MRRAPGEPGKRRRLVGFAISGAAGGQGYLQRLAVLPEHQREGHGRALALDALAWMRRRRLSHGVVNTAVTNAPALSLYESLGFRRLPEQLLVMQLDLDHAMSADQARRSPRLVPVVLAMALAPVAAAPPEPTTPPALRLIDQDFAIARDAPWHAQWQCRRDGPAGVRSACILYRPVDDRVELADDLAGDRQDVIDSIASSAHAEPARRCLRHRCST